MGASDGVSGAEIESLSQQLTGRPESYHLQNPDRIRRLQARRAYLIDSPDGTRWHLIESQQSLCIDLLLIVASSILRVTTGALERWYPSVGSVRVLDEGHLSQAVVC